MTDNEATYQVAIVGGGPVGLFLGCCLHARGISCIVLEKRPFPIQHSRSIGIHPVSLEALQTVGLARPLIQEGVKIKEGMVFMGAEYLGSLSFESCPPPYSYILTLAQHRTEAVLADRLHEMNPNMLRRGAAVTAVQEESSHVTLHISERDKTYSIKARYLAGCDGKNSLIRNLANIPFDETAYNDTYVMGDFSDNTPWKHKAAVFICEEGLIESFPLADSKRRWVVKTDSYLADEDRYHIERLIKQRISHDLTETENIMISSFGVQKALAGTMAKSRIVLAGDAAHLVSPIGGQGMNLGWLDAWKLAVYFEMIFTGGQRPANLLQEYSRNQLRIAKKAIRRAEFNMGLGNAMRYPAARKIALKVVLTKPISGLMARAFTMRGLSTWPL